MRYRGLVGTGFSADSLRELKSRMGALEVKKPPVAQIPSLRRAAHWVKPVLVAEIQFAAWTEAGLLRQPSFQGLREDKSAREIVLETPKHVERNGASARPRPDAQPLLLTHPDKVLFPDAGITKARLSRYFEKRAEAILRHIARRPLSLVRCPAGAGKSCFFQRHLSGPPAPGMIEIPVTDAGKTVNYFGVEDENGLLGLAQIGVLEIHVWGCAAGAPLSPEVLHLDLDPDPSFPWARQIQLAQEMRAYLEGIGLVPFAKLTGGKGIHLSMPLETGVSWDELNRYAKAIADDLVRLFPEELTADMSKRARHGKIYVDYQRNAFAATAIAPWSPRNKAHASIALPLAWEFLSARMKPDSVTISNVDAWLKRHPEDPWRDWEKSRKALPRIDGVEAGSARGRWKRRGSAS